MNERTPPFCLLCLMAAALMSAAGCRRADADVSKGAPPQAKVTPAMDSSLFSVDNPEQFPLTSAIAHPAASELVVTGTVNPDVSRSHPVVSLASGRVVGIHARLGDTVQKGQLLMTVRSDDVSGGYANYRMAVADELLARAQYERAKDLFEHGAIAQNDLQIAKDTEDKAQVAVETAAEHLRLIGNNPEKPQSMVDIFAPVSGVITDQQVTESSAVQAFQTPYPFTISNLSSVWVLCDVYENDLGTVRLGDSAEIKLNAFPDRMFRGKISNISPILDPTIRTGKVRIEVENPGIMRVGMFVKATFHSQTAEMHTIVPASAILHMHDRDFIFAPEPDKKFRRIEVVSGDLLPENLALQEIRSGLKPGQQLVTNALVLDHVLGQ